MRYFLFVPTIDPTGGMKISDKAFSEISNDTGVDVATLRNSFYGKGIACLRSHSDPEEPEKIAEALSLHSIPSLFTRTADIEEIPVFQTVKLILRPNGIEFRTASGKYGMSFDQPIAIASNIEWTRDSIQRSVIKGEQFVIASANQAFIFRAKSVVVENVPGLTKYSRTHNTALFLENLFKQGQRLYVDSSFQRLQVVLRGDFPRYAQFLSTVVNSGFLESDFPQTLLEEQELEEVSAASYNHRVYRGFDLFRHRYLHGLRAATMDHTSLAWILLFFLTYSGLRIQSSALIGIGLGLITLSLNIRFFQLFHLKNLVQDIPVSKLRSVSAGFVEVMGRVHAKDRFISPVSGAECVYFRYRKESMYRTRNGYGWQTVEIGEAFSEDCYLDDGTGIISLNLKNANFSVTSRETVNHTYAELNAGMTPVPGMNNTRYTEEYLQDGRTVYVMGTATPVNPLRRFGEYLSEVKKDKDRLLRFDLNGDGVIDEPEWQAALPKLRREFLGRYMDKGQSFSLMLDFRKDFPVFLVSDQPEEKLLKKLKWKVPGTFVLGFLTFIGFLIFMISTFGG